MGNRLFSAAVWCLTHSLTTEHIFEIQEELQLRESMLKLRERNEELSPYRDVIDAWIPLICGQSMRSPYGPSSWSVKAFAVRKFIEDHVLVHGDLPTGNHDFGTIEFRNDDLTIGEIDFDAVAFSHKSIKS